MAENTWTCPYWYQNATITIVDVSSSTHEIDVKNKEGEPLWLYTFVTVCPNVGCREYVVDATLYKTSKPFANAPRKIVSPALQSWKLRPRSRTKIFPGYIPEALIADYQEACLICDDSPKASATLSRRCLQGIIRDYWGIRKNRLVDEIKELEGKIDSNTWEAIDAVRSIGNIGAHMEKDINLVVDVEPDEAAVLLQLIETLFQDWYVSRHDRQEHMQRLVAIAQAKSEQRQIKIETPETS